MNDLFFKNLKKLKSEQQCKQFDLSINTFNSFIN